MVWFLDAFFKPNEFYAEEKGKADYFRAVLNYELPYLFYGVILLVLGAFLLSLLASLPQVRPIAGLLGGIGIVFLVGMLVFQLLVAIVYNAVLFGVAKVFGGTGSFKQQFYTLSVVSIAGFVVGIGSGIILAVLMLLLGSAGGILIGLLVLALVLLVIIAGVAAIKQIHEFSTLKTIGVLVVSVIVLFIIAFLLASALTAIIIATLLKSAVRPV